jgi:membrane protein YqaA with SNARE-associated domain
MSHFIAQFEAFALLIGGPGLFAIAFLDSSVLSLPEIVDLLLIVMTARQPNRMVYYAFMSTVGSIAGCLLVYYLALKGGETFLRKRLQGRRVDRVMRLTRRYGGLALLVPALLPPPAPFKPFVLMAGVGAVPIRTFVGAIAVGRGIRYFGEGLLAIWWGEVAIDYVRQNEQIVGFILAGLAVFGIAGYIVWKIRTRAAV